MAAGEIYTGPKPGCRFFTSGLRADLPKLSSLQRKLAEAGLSYQELVDATRKTAASEYLSNATLSIGEVGYLLGYSEPAAFHRAFKRWHGVAPQVFRGQRAAGTSSRETL